MNNPASFAVLAVVGLFALTGIFGSFYTVDQGEVGVVLRNGAISGVSQPGLGFKTPLIEDVATLSTRVEKAKYTTMVYSADTQPADITIAVNYRMDPSAAEQVYSQYRSVEGAKERIITPRVMDKSKAVFGRFTANKAISERERLSVEMSQEIRESMTNSGIIVDSVQIENLDFSDAYEKSVEDRMLAEVEVAKLQQNLARETVQADIKRTQAKATADAAKSIADAEAYAKRVQGEAEADAINAKGKALRDNPALIQLTAAEKWNGTLPTTMVPGNAVPFVNIDKK